jgi:hypothetical protein
MGIDIYLKWKRQSKKDKKKQTDCGFSTTSGAVGYLREAYHGGPYATKILVREAFEAEDCQAQIPAAVMRERLTNVTEPAMDCDGGHNTSMMLIALLTEMSEKIGRTAVTPKFTASGKTTPMTVEEAVRERCLSLYPEDGEELVNAVIQSFRDFVTLAELKEAKTGKPCTVYASY